VAAIDELTATGCRAEDVGAALRAPAAQGELVEKTGTKAPSAVACSAGR